jgi:secreted trypsin-like serine protease
MASVRRLHFAALALALSSVASGHDLIAGGTTLKKGDPLAKFVVGIRVGHQRCSGTLIARNIVLTAAHCLVDQKTNTVIPDAKPIRVAFDRFESLTLQFIPLLNSALAPAADFEIADGYLTNGKHFDAKVSFFTQFRKLHDLNDVALIRLRDDAPSDFTPVALARKSELDTYASTILVAGFGMVYDSPDAMSGQLKSASMSLADSGGRVAEITTNPGNGTVCSGDSGGPLLIKTPREGYKLAGVIDESIHDCQGGAIAARIDGYTDFLGRAMARLGSTSRGLFTVDAP